MPDIILVLPVLLFSMVAHEFAHGYTALKQGDDTAYKLGRLTLNPLKHIDPWLTVIMPIALWIGSGGRFVFGGAKPVPVNPRNYRHYKKGDIIVSSAGIVTNIGLTIVAVLLVVVLGLLGGGPESASPEALVLLQRMMFWGIWINLLLAFFNLIPIPPLDGSHLLYHLLPPPVGAKYRELARYGFLIIIGLLIFFPSALPILLLPAILLGRLSMDITAPFALEPFAL